MRQRPPLPDRARRRPGRALLLLAAAALLAGCAPQPSRLELIRAHGQLRVATLNQPTAYYLAANGAQGYEYRLAHAFAQRLNVQLVIQPFNDVAELREALRSGDADVVAAQLSADEQWRRSALISNNYRRVAQLVVQRRGTRPLRSMADLRGKRLVVAAGSPQLEQLGELRQGAAPFLSWTELRREQADPIEWVASDDADCAIVDEPEFRFAQFTTPDTVIAFALPEKRALQWMLPRDAPELRDAVNAFLRDAERSGLLAQLETVTRAEVQDFEYVGARNLQADVSERLPALQPLFAAAAAQYGLDWRLVAAVGYQESKWDPTAHSDAGAEGVMMLTESTAQSLGVTDRRDPAQNIQAGASYLAKVRDMIPARIREPDRTWLALAAYNVGFGHLEDARILAQSQGRDADSWNDVKTFLPLLAEERWYRLAKRGYARGWEPVKFVEQVANCLSVLQWQQPGGATPEPARPGEPPRGQPARPPA